MNVSKFNIGDLVVLKSGSMRMVVEDAASDGSVHVVWCHEGIIGRDTFNPALLNKWEHREDSPQRTDRGAPRGGGRPYGGDRDGGGKPYGGRDRDGGRDRGHDDRPRKTGWDGKPREKKFYRKDD